jgi:C4-dicarboxylate-specific signal transduction histidine kinase
MLDTDLTKGILTNLLENAADAVGRGGIIRVALKSNGASTEILVEDSGPGLSLLAKETLFQPTISFKRTGMGLGLSIAKRSAMLMGGDLDLVDSSLGGAAFLLRLPAATLEKTLTEPAWQNESSSSMTKKTLAAPFA